MFGNSRARRDFDQLAGEFKLMQLGASDALMNGLPDYYATFAANEEYSIRYQKMHRHAPVADSIGRENLISGSVAGV